MTARSRVLVLLALAAVVAAATVLVGWWAPAAVAALFGLFAPAHLRRVTGTATLAALLAWGGLLLFDAVGPRFGAVAGGLAGAMGIPAAAIAAVTLAFAALLAWSAATLAEAVGRRALGRAERAAARRGGAGPGPAAPEGALSRPTAAASRAEAAPQ